MRKQYYEIYRDLYDIYRLNQSDAERRFGPFGRRYQQFSDMRTLRMIDDAISQARSELGLMDRVRPDAQLFLLVNIHQMLALPLALSEATTGEPQVAIEEYIREDVRTILEAARDESKDEEVSGHAIVDALTRTWEKLQLNKLEVWG